MSSWIKDVPKLDLHRHVTATMTNEFLNKLVEKYDIQTNSQNNLNKLKNLDFTSPQEFFTHHTYARSLIREKSDFKELSKHIVSQLEFDKIIYTELLFSPQFYLERGFQLAEILTIFESEFKYSSTDINLIIEFSRSRDQLSAQKTFSEVKNYIESNNVKKIKGISIGGDEVNYRARPFKNLFQEAKKIDLKTIAHAGEWKGPESVWEVLEQLSVSRIIHGINSIQDNNLLAYLKNNNIPLDISISSNYSTGAITKDKKHPILDLKKRGVKILLSTDIPGYLNITQSTEFNKLLKMGLSKKDIFEIILNTIEASITTLEEKEKMKEFLEQKKHYFFET